MPEIDMNAAANAVQFENMKTTAASGSHALARTYGVQADFDNLVSKSAAASFDRRQGMLDLAMSKAIEDQRYADADAARATERVLGHPTAESSTNLAASLASAIGFSKMMFGAPPSGWTVYPGPGEAQRPA